MPAPRDLLAASSSTSCCHHKTVLLWISHEHSPLSPHLLFCSPRHSLFSYGLNAINAKITTPEDVNFSDDELLLLPFYTHLALAGRYHLQPPVTTTNAATAAASASANTDTATHGHANHAAASAAAASKGYYSAAAVKDPELVCGFARAWEQASWHAHRKERAPSVSVRAGYCGNLILRISTLFHKPDWLDFGLTFTWLDV